MVTEPSGCACVWDETNLWNRHNQLYKITCMTLRASMSKLRPSRYIRCKAKPFAHYLCVLVYRNELGYHDAGPFGVKHKCKPFLILAELCPYYIFVVETHLTRICNTTSTIIFIGHHTIDGKYYERIWNAFVFPAAGSYNTSVCPVASCLQLGTAAIHILAVHAQDLTHKEINITIILDSDKNHILNAVCEAS